MWLLRLPIQRKPPKLKAPSLSLFLFFPSLNSSPKTTSKRPPDTFRPGRVSSQTLFSPPTLSFGWLLCFLTKQRPPKAKTPSPSLFFDGLCFDAPNKG